MKRRLRAICLAPLGAALVLPAAAHAQSAQAGDAADSSAPSTAEIIVTATKQNTALSRVAAAVTAVTAADIGPGGVQNVGDLQVEIGRAHV